jgi:hypothetical protein
MEHLIPNNKHNKSENHAHETHTGKDTEIAMRMIMNGGVNEENLEDTMKHLGINLDDYRDETGKGICPVSLEERSKLKIKLAALKDDPNTHH